MKAAVLICLAAIAAVAMLDGIWWVDTQAAIIACMIVVLLRKR